MAFISFPFNFADDDFEEKQNLKQKIRYHKGTIIINTQCICSYNEMDNNDVVIRMANGDMLEIPLKIKDFESILYKTEILVTLAALKEN